MTLSDAGRAAAEAFHSEASARLERLLTPLPAAARDDFRRSMARVIASAKTALPGCGLDERPERSGEKRST